MKRRQALIALLLAGCTPALAADSTFVEKLKNYLPEIHGTIRGKYEYQPQIESGRFQVRNARFSLTGKVNRYTSYKAEIDLSDEGKIKMLDAFGELKPVAWGSVTLGQMRVPFTIDARRSPHTQSFVNRSFVAKQVANVRDVGGKITLTPTNVPLIFEIGAYNGPGVTEQKTWHKSINFSSELQWFPVKGWNITLSAQKVQPGTTRANMYDIGSYYEHGRWHIEAEYLYKHYADKAFDPVNAVNAFVKYGIPTKGFFNRVMLLARYDMMNNHWDGVTTDGNGKALVTDYARQRITGGVTLGIGRPQTTELRFNYEKYFYHHDGIPDESERDKICVELMVRF